MVVIVVLFLLCVTNCFFYCEKNTVNFVRTFYPLLYNPCGMCAANVTDAEIAIVRAIEKTLQSNFNTKYSLPVLVRMYSINVHRLTEIFHLVTGVTITEYRILQRVEAAKLLLTTTSDSIETISVQVGYEGARPLKKVFKKITGYTPHEYRKLNTGRGENSF